MSDTSLQFSKPLWRIKARSVPGVTHRKQEEPCQDYNFYDITDNGLLIAAVGDGAGTAPFGGEGAKLATQTAVETLKDIIVNQDQAAIDWSQALQDAFVRTRERLQIEAQVLDVEIRELATTLILVAASADLVVAAQIGDGACVVGNIHGALRTVGKPATGEFLNDTVFLTSEGFEAALQKTRWPDPSWPDRVAHLAIFSDGLQRLAMKMPQNEPHPPFFEPLWTFADEELDPLVAEVQLNEFLLSDRIKARTDDDLTLLLASLVSPRPSLNG
jgi:hypothetical protein